MIRFKHEPFVFLYLILIALAVGYDMLSVYSSIAPAKLFEHLLLQGFTLFLTLSGVVYLSSLIIIESRHKERFLSELEHAREHLSEISEKMTEGKRDFIKLIDWQFDEWKLSVVEKEVGMLILKGLSFEEIATIRQTTARTARKQATAIYAKANLSNRNEFAAWFLEDLL